MKQRMRTVSLLVLICAVGWNLPATADEHYQLIYLDGHIHTTHSDGSGSLADVKEVALARGLSAVITTNHTKQIVDVNEWNSIITESHDLSDPNFLMIPAFEVTGSEGYLLRDHVLAWGVKDPFVGDDANALAPEEVWPSPRNHDGTGPLHPEHLQAWVDYIHEQSGLAVHVHTWGTTQPEYGVDFIELLNVGTVKSIVKEVAATGVPLETAYHLGFVMNNFSTYGDRDLNMMVEIPGIGEAPLRTALNAATGAWLGAPEAAPLHSWDELLLLFVNGEIPRPIFGVANSDAHNTANTDMANTDPTYDNSDVGEGKNGGWVERLNESSVLSALKAGRFFATSGPSLAFTINGKMMGETVTPAKEETVQISLSGNAESPTAVIVMVDVIKNGEVFHTLTPNSPTFEVTLEDADVTNGYYRAEIIAMDMATEQYDYAWANPVFVRR